MNSDRMPFEAVSQVYESPYKYCLYPRGWRTCLLLSRVAVASCGFSPTVLHICDQEGRFKPIRRHQGPIARAGHI